MDEDYARNHGRSHHLNAIPGPTDLLRDPVKLWSREEALSRRPCPIPATRAIADAFVCSIHEHPRPSEVEAAIMRTFVRR